MGTVDQIGQRRWSHGAIDSCDCTFQRRTIQQGPFRADYETEEVRLSGGGQGKGKAGCLAQSRKGGGQQEVGPGVCQFPGLPGVELQRLVDKQRLSRAVGIPAAAHQAADNNLLPILSVTLPQCIKKPEIVAVQIESGITGRSDPFPASRQVGVDRSSGKPYSRPMSRYC